MVIGELSELGDIKQKCGFGQASSRETHMDYCVQDSIWSKRFCGPPSLPIWLYGREIFEMCIYLNEGLMKLGTHVCNIE